MTWGVYKEDGIPVPPRVYSNGKTQDHVVDEIIDAFEDNSVVQLYGVIGTGKSIVAKLVCAYYGSGIISVPVKLLQQQYEKDEKYVNLGEGRIRISHLLGRDNYPCPFGGRDCLASARNLPCTRRLGKTERRWEAAIECPHWNPIYPSPMGEVFFSETIHPYLTVPGRKYYHDRGDGCGYYRSFKCYLGKGIIVMNSAKWFFETVIGRKPLTSVEVVDEEDVWLSSLTLRMMIGERVIDRLEGFGIVAARGRFIEALEGRKHPVDFLSYLQHLFTKEELEESGFEDLVSRIELLLLHKDILSWDVNKKEKRIQYFCPYPEIVLKRLLDKSAKRILLMSATPTSREALREVYKLDPAYIEAETAFPGTVYPGRTGTEQVINHRTWEFETVREKVRERFWDCLDTILELATPPRLVNVHAYKYLPKNRRGRVPSAEDVAKNQDSEIPLFLAGNKDTIFTTKMDRGVDLPFERCNSVVLLKYPYPLRADPVLLAMEKRLGKHVFDKYYQDLAAREFIQSVGRAVRAPTDQVEFWSPDQRCHTALRRLWRGKIIA